MFISLQKRLSVIEKWYSISINLNDQSVKPLGNNETLLESKKENDTIETLEIKESKVSGFFKKLFK